MSEKTGGPFKVETEMAEYEFDRFVELMDLDINTAKMDEDDRKGFETQKDRMVSAICKGSLVISEKGEPVFTPQRSEQVEPLTFREPTGASLMSMDRKKKNHDVSKLFGFMADVTGAHASTFSKMKLPDLNVCTAITTLFLG